MTDLFVKIVDFPAEVESAEWVNVEWVAIESNSNVSSRDTCSLAEISASIEDVLESDAFEKVVVFVPDELALFCRVPVPGRTVSQMRRALPYVVESYVVEDIEDLHIATNEIRRSRPVDTLSIGKNKLRSLVEMLVEAHVVPTYIGTLGTHIPTDERTVVVANDGAKFIIKSEDQLAVVESEDVVDSVSLMVPDESEESPNILQVVTSADAWTVDFDDQTPFEVVKQRHVESDLLTDIALNFDARNGVNLAQGAFAIDATNRSSARRWAITAMLGAGGFLFYTGIVFSQGLWAKIQAADTFSESVELYESIYGSSPGNRHPATRMRANLGQTGTETSAIQGFFDAIADELARRNTGIQLNSFVFNDTTKEMRLVIEVRDFDRLETVQESLQSESLDVEIVSAEQRQDGIRANLTLSLQQ